MGYVIFFVIMAVIVAMVANSKGRSGMAWFFYGLLIWPIALVHALLLKPVSAQPKGESTYQENPDGPRRCPSPECGKIVHGLGDVCPYCNAPMDGVTQFPCPKCGEMVLTHLPVCPSCHYDRADDPDGLMTDERECPFCAELIKKKAKKCKHCGSVVEPVLAPMPEPVVTPGESEDQELTDAKAKHAAHKQETQAAGDALKSRYGVKE